METIFLSDVDHLIFFLFFTLDVAFKVKELPFFKFLEVAFNFKVVLASLVMEKVKVQTNNNTSVIMVFKYLFFIKFFSIHVMNCHLLKMKPPSINKIFPLILSAIC
jgi:hypothetical protein